MPKIYFESSNKSLFKFFFSEINKISSVWTLGDLSEFRKAVKRGMTVQLLNSSVS
jgi:hypothetical protein